VAFTCTELGLLPGDTIDALALISEEGNLDVLFSVSTSSVGAAGSAVEGLNLERSLGATIFASSGDGANRIQIAARQLGLAEWNDDDDVDGLTLIDAPQPSVVHAASCTLATDPFAADPGGGLQYVYRTLSLPPSVMVLVGEVDELTTRALAYDVSTCAELGRQDLPPEFAGWGLAVIPQAGWSATKPLEKVDYLRVVDADDASTRVLRSYDAAGQFVSELPISSMLLGSYVYSMVHDPAHGQLFVFTNGNGYNDRIDVLPLPSEGTTQIEGKAGYTTLPCATGEAVTGVDAAGNVYLAQYQLDDVTFRVCGFTPSGELLPAPYTWTTQSGGNNGFIVPGSGYYMLNLGETSTIERGAFQAP
jgi:hypothetical protein